MRVGKQSYGNRGGSRTICERRHMLLDVNRLHVRVKDKLYVIRQKSCFIQLFLFGDILSVRRREQDYRFSNRS